MVPPVVVNAPVAAT